MEILKTRDLVHRTKAIRESLVAGHSYRWESRGKLIAVIQPPGGNSNQPPRDWVQRAQSAGAINQTSATVSDLIYQERD